MKKKVLVLLCCLALLTSAIAGCGGETANNDSQQQGQEGQMEKVVVGCTAKPHAEILEVVKPMLAEQNVDLEIKEFTDYVLINPALKDGQIDANFFQHTPYLDDYNAKNNANLTTVVKVHNEPMGVYSKKIDDLSKLADGSTVAIPNDATNGGRALLVLESAGLIKLKDGVGVTATEADVAENAKDLKIVMMDAPMLPKTLDDKTVAIAVINSNYALEANLNPVNDSIFMEPSDSPFANILVVRPEDKDKEVIQKLAKTLQTPEVKKFLEDTYKGACVPSF